MASEFKKDDVLLNPASRTAMWRVLEVKDDRIRIVRSAKSGVIHSMARDKDGQWRHIADLSSWQVLGRVGQVHEKKKYQPQTTTGSTALPAKTTRNTVGGGRINGSIPREAKTDGDGMRIFLKTMETFHESAAEGFRQMQKEFSGSRR